MIHLLRFYDSYGMEFCKFLYRFDTVNVSPLNLDTVHTVLKRCTDKLETYDNN